MLISKTHYQFINLYALEDSLEAKYIEQICEKAMVNKVASLTILPQYLNQTFDILKGSQIKIACVLNYPHGEETLPNIEKAAKILYESGADEIELILPYTKFLNTESVEDIVNYITTVKDIILERKVLRINIEATKLSSSLHIHQICKNILPLNINFIKNVSPPHGKTTILQINPILEEIASSGADCGIDVHIDETTFGIIPDIMRLQKIIIPKIKNFTKRNLRFSLSLENFEKVLQAENI